MSMVAKAGGFLLVPGLLSRIALPRVVKEEDTFDRAALKGAATYGAIALGAYYASKHLPRSLEDFAMGAVWGAGIASATMALAPLAIPKDRQASTLGIYKRFYGVQAPALPASVAGAGPSGAERVIAALTGH